jgi:hypothetical protein
VNGESAVERVVEVEGFARECKASESDSGVEGKASNAGEGVGNKMMVSRGR